MQNRRECGHPVSEQALACPGCGAPRPARAAWDGWGFEYKSRLTLFGLPLLHIAFKFRPNLMPVPAVGIIAIGQFGAGVINITQFGIGLIGIGQFCIGGWVLAQFAAGYRIIAQIGLYWESGHGQIVSSLQALTGL